MFVKELGKTAGVPSVYTLPVCVLGQWKFKICELWKLMGLIKTLRDFYLKTQPYVHD